MISNHAPLTPEQAEGFGRLLSELDADQALWLSGFFAGYSARPREPAPEPSAPPALTILYGTESGNSEELAERSKKAAQQRGFHATTKDMGDIQPASLEGVGNLLVIVSTWGEGDPPERAVGFHRAFMKDGGPNLEGTRFSVCGLGDTSYEHFCRMGRDFDQRLEELGGKRVAPRADCDVDFEEPYQKWIKTALAALENQAPPAPAAAPAIAPAAAPAWSRSHPFEAELLERVNLSGTGSAKETWHLELSLKGSGIHYLPGDSLGVKPRNCPAVIDDLVQTAGLAGDEEVNRPDGSAGPLREVLIEELDSTVLTRKVVAGYAEMAHNDSVRGLLDDEDALKSYLAGREIVDLFHDYRPQAVQPQQLADLLRILPPRLYSIASSLRAHPEEVHLTVGAVRYQTHGRSRKGVASTYLVDRLDIGDKAPVYVHANNNFRLPEDPSTPVIMVGPGTGIAPFRAFLEERAATGASGGNWLFFGDQHYTYDFLYQLEIKEFLEMGVLHRLNVAFSRDSPEKVYVQHRMREMAADLYQWLENGACFYVCGDAARMAKDVHHALVAIISEQGNLSAPDAEQLVNQMRKEKRYQRDVY